MLRMIQRKMPRFENLFQASALYETSDARLEVATYERHSLEEIASLVPNPWRRVRSTGDSEQYAVWRHEITGELICYCGGQWRRLSLLGPCWGLDKTMMRRFLAS